MKTNKFSPNPCEGSESQKTIHAQCLCSSFESPKMSQVVPNIRKRYLYRETRGKTEQEEHTLVAENSPPNRTKQGYWAGQIRSPAS